MQLSIYEALSLIPSTLYKSGMVVQHRRGRIKRIRKDFKPCLSYLVSMKANLEHVKLSEKESEGID